jgi:phospholipid/cholesterol/gamma-HCH transport system substrate-binding protein
MLVGVFTLVVIFGGFGFVWWFQRLGDGGARAPYEIVYESSVSGLRSGSVVNFNGIRVGEVTAIQLDREDPRKVVATIAISSATPVRTDTKAGLEFQGLTGVATVSLTGGTPSSPALKGEGGKPARIVADSSQTADVMQGAKALMARIDGIAVRIDKLIETNEKKVDQILSDVAVFTKDLAGKDGRTVVTEVGDATKEIGAAAKSVRDLAEQLNSSTEPTIKEYLRLAQDARRAVGDLTRVIRDFERNPSQIVWGRRNGAPTPGGVTAGAASGRRNP